MLFFFSLEYSESAIPSYPPPSFVSSYSLNRTDDDDPLCDNPPSYEVATSSHVASTSHCDATTSQFDPTTLHNIPTLSQVGSSSSSQTEPE